MTADDGGTFATWAPAGILCQKCREVVILKIPVDVWLVTADGETRLRAAVPETAEGYEQPLWDHMLDAHGPDLDGEATG